MNAEEKAEATERLMSKVSPEPNSGCWLWDAARDPHGYGALHIRGRLYKSHRLSYALFVGELSPHLQVMHKCDVRSCVNPDHLMQGTNDDNVRDMVRKRRQSFGERRPDAKIRAADVRAIRADPRTQIEIARQYGVRRQTISKIQTGASWGHIA